MIGRKHNDQKAKPWKYQQLQEQKKGLVSYEEEGGKSLTLKPGKINKSGTGISWFIELLLENKRYPFNFIKGYAVIHNGEWGVVVREFGEWGQRKVMKDLFWWEESQRITE